MNHSAAVCRQCSKTYTDIGDDKPYCAECLLTMPVEPIVSGTIECMNVMERLDAIASLDDRPHWLPAIDAVTTWLMGGERNRSAEDAVIEMLFEVFPRPDDFGWSDSDVDDAVGLVRKLNKGLA